MHIVCLEFAFDLNNFIENNGSGGELLLMELLLQVSLPSAVPEEFLSP